MSRALLWKYIVLPGRRIDAVEKYTSAGLNISPGRKTLFSHGEFRTKAPLVPVLGTRTESGPLVPVAITNQN